MSADLPRALRAASPVLTAEARAAAHSIFDARAPPFRIFLDDTCGMPSDWRTNRSAEEESSDYKYIADLLIPLMIDSSPYMTSDWTIANASVVVLAARKFGGPVVAAERCRRRMVHSSPAWRATQGARHFFLLTSDRGPCCNDGTMLRTELLAHHVVGNHGEVEGHHWRYASLRTNEVPNVACFHPYKDISIPTPNRRRAPSDVDTADAPPTRDLLFFYAGAGRFSIDRHVFRGVREGRRTLLASFWNSTDRDVLVVPALTSKTTSSEYRRHLLRAKYCPVMGGFAPWTPRFIESIFAGCVPVVFSSWLLPFSRLIDWSKCSVRVGSLQDAPRLRAILEAQDYSALAAGVAAARHALWYNVGPYDGGGMLPFLLLEMHGALVEAARRPLVARMAALIGTQAQAEPMQNTLRGGRTNSTLYRVGQTAVHTLGADGASRQYECSMVFGSRPLHTTHPDAIYEPFASSSTRTYVDTVHCACKRVRGPPTNEPISPTQRLLGPRACTNLAADARAARGNCTQFSGQPDALDRWLQPRQEAKKLAKAPKPFSSTGCLERFCPSSRGRKKHLGRGR